MPYFFALVATILFALGSVMQSRFIRSGGSVRAVIIINNVPVGLALLPWVLTTVDLLAIPAFSFLLLLLNGLIWSVSCFYRTLAYEHIDASIALIFGTMNLLLLTVSGMVIFGESLTFLNCLGLLLTVVAIIVSADLKSVRVTRAVKYIAISCIGSATAVSMTKYLSDDLPVSLIVMNDFLIPGLAALLISSKRVHLCKMTMAASNNWVIALPVLCGIGYYLKILAFASGGALIAISIIEQTGILFVLALEFLVLQAIPNLQRRCLAGGLCLCGAILVTAF